MKLSQIKQGMKIQLSDIGACTLKDRMRQFGLVEGMTVFCRMARKNIVGLDVVETASDRLGDNTAVVAAKIIYDFLTLID